MPILNVQTSVTGLSGTVPSFIYLNTNDTATEVQTTGYLNNLKNEGYNVGPNQMALVQTSDVGVDIFKVTVSGGNTTLVPIFTQGGVETPVNVDHIAVYTNTGGTISDDAPTAINAGNIQAGLDGTAGELISYPAGLNSGNLIISAGNNLGNYSTVITNVSMAEAVTIEIPDPGQGTSTFILANASIGQVIATGNLGIAQGNLEVTAGNFIVDAGTASILSGNLTVGNGATHAGVITLLPGTVNYGAVHIAAQGNASNTTTSYSMGPMGQQTNITVPDPANAHGQILIAPGITPFVSGNIPVASGTAGVMIDSGIAASSLGASKITYGESGAQAGGSTTYAYTLSALSSITQSSIVTITCTGQQNSAYPLVVKPGTDISGGLPQTGSLYVAWNTNPGTHTFSFFAVVTP